MTDILLALLLAVIATAAALLTVSVRRAAKQLHWIAEELESANAIANRDQAARASDVWGKRSR